MPSREVASHEDRGASKTLLSATRAWNRSWHLKRPRGEFWLFFSGAIFFNFGFSVFFLLFNLFLLKRGLNERALGIIGSLMAVGSMVGTIPVGILAQRFGLRRVLTTGLLLTVFFSVLRILTLWQPAQFLLAVLTGMTLCCWAVCLSPAVAGLTTEQQRPLGFSLIFASGIGVAGLGGFAGGRIPGMLSRLPFVASADSSQAYRAALLIGCAVAAVAAVPISRITLRVAAPSARLPSWSNSFLRRFLVAMAVWSLVTGAFPPFANVYFVHHLGVSTARLGLIFSISQLFQFTAILSAPFLFRRVGLTSGILLTQVGTAATLACLAIVHTTSQAALIYWLYMSTQCMNEPSIYSLLMDWIPVDEHHGASASTFFVSSVSQAVASAAVGAGLMQFGYGVVLSTVAGLALLAAVLFRRLQTETESTPRTRVSAGAIAGT